MNARRTATVALLLGLLTAPAAAQDPEITMRVIPEAAADARAILAELIRLPAAASEQGASSSAAGLATANASRAQAAAQRAAALGQLRGSPAPGLAAATEARERGAEMAEVARTNREDVGRGRDQPGRAAPAELPGPPDGLPSRPEAPLPTSFPGP